MFRHFVNFALLFFFVTLGVTGALSFFRPFNLTTTRVHVVFGFGVLILVGTHLAARGPYFARMVGWGRKSGEKRIPVRMLSGVLALWVLALIAALWNLPPVPQWVEQGYEARHRATIFRADPLIAYQTIGEGLRVKRDTPESQSNVLVQIEWGPAYPAGGEASTGPQIAIWAESGAGTLIETLFLSEKAAFSESFPWGNDRVSRVDVLPIWRNRYALATGITPDGSIDAYSGATPEHSFTLESHLNTDSKPFYLYVEVNAHGDTNDFYRPDRDEDHAGRTKPGLGQPSVIHGAYIAPTDEKKYYLLDLVGHGSAQMTRDGAIHYDMEGLTTSQRIIEKILVRVVWGKD